MPRAVWSGSISFGLVNVPVKAYPAVREKDVRFRQLHDADGGRIVHKRFCSLEDKEVDSDHIVKGYQTAPDEYVVVEPQDLENLDPEATHRIDLQEFVDLRGIDPLHFQRPYYLAPEPNATKAYRLLAEAMRRRGRVAVGKIVLRGKEHLVALRPHGDTLVMTTLLYHDEVLPTNAIEALEAERPAPDAREMQVAERLIDALTTDFDPTRYEDTYRERVLDLIEQKAAGRTIVAPAEPKKPGAPPADLASALEASLRAVEERAKA